MRCYCSICRKTSGAGGYGINLGGDAKTLQFTGQEHLKVYRAKRESGALSSHHRYFCGECGSHLWAQNSRWPDLVHPVAGAVDTPLPPAPEVVHIMVDSKASWVPAPPEGATTFAEYPNESLAHFHERHGYQE